MSAERQEIIAKHRRAQPVAELLRKCAKAQRKGWQTVEDYDVRWVLADELLRGINWVNEP